MLREVITLQVGQCGNQGKEEITIVFVKNHQITKVFYVLGVLIEKEHRIGTVGFFSNRSSVKCFLLSNDHWML